MTKSAKIRALSDKGVSPSEIAKQVGTSLNMVYSTRWKMKKAKKKVAKKKNKVKKKQTLADLLARTPKEVTKVEREAEALMSKAWDRDMARDNVNSPDHYTVGGIETIDYIEAKKLGYNLGNAIKYISRAPHKGKHLEDLKKAQWYLDREIENIEFAA